ALMLVNCGGPEVRELPVTPSQKEAISGQAKQVSLDAILAGLEVWTATRSRMRDTGHSQVLLEMAIVRLCRMDELLSVGQLVQAVSQPATAGGAGIVGSGRQLVAPPEALEGAKKNGPLTVQAAPNGQADSGGLSTVLLTEATLPEVW